MASLGPIPALVTLPIACGEIERVKGAQLIAKTLSGAVHERFSPHLAYRPGRPTSNLRLRLPTESLQILAPPDTAEIRKVTEAMRTEVLHVDRYPETTFTADSLSAKSGKMEMQRWCS